MSLLFLNISKKKFVKLVERKPKYVQFCSFFLLKCATSGDNTSWNISAITAPNHTKLVSNPPFSRMGNSFLLLTIHIFTTRWHYKQINPFWNYFTSDKKLSARILLFMCTNLNLGLFCDFISYIIF